GGGRTDAADARAHSAGAAGGSAVDRGGAEQGGRGGRSGAARAGRDGGAGPVEELQVPGRRDSGSADLGSEGDERGGGGGEGDPEADGGGGPLHTASAAPAGQAVPDADRGYFLDLRPR